MDSMDQGPDRTIKLWAELNLLTLKKNKKFIGRGGMFDPN
jgi:hypothetical protein